MGGGRQHRGSPGGATFTLAGEKKWGKCFRQSRSADNAGIVHLGIFLDTGRRRA